jgi:hypothetical protein
LKEEVIKLLTRLIEEEKPESVKKLTDLAKARLSISKEEIVRHVLYLQAEGKVILRRPSQPTSSALTGYLKTKEASWFWATITLAVTTTLVVFIIPEDAVPQVYIRNVLGAAFLTGVPGYSLVRALFPLSKQSENNGAKIDTIERVALSIGLSLALVPLVGLLLNYTQWGVSLAPVMLSLLTLTAVLATIALTRELQGRRMSSVQTQNLPQ